MCTKTNKQTYHYYTHSLLWLATAPAKAEGAGIYSPKLSLEEMFHTTRDLAVFPRAAFQKQRYSDGFFPRHHMNRWITYGPFFPSTASISWAVSGRGSKNSVSFATVAFQAGFLRTAVTRRHKGPGFDARYGSVNEGPMNRWSTSIMNLSLLDSEWLFGLDFITIPETGSVYKSRHILFSTISVSAIGIWSGGERSIHL